MAVVLTLVQTKKWEWIYINETIQKHSTNNTKHSKCKHTYYQNSHSTHTHTLWNKLKQPQYKIHTKWNSHNTLKYPQYKVTVMCMVICPQELHRNSKIFTVVFPRLVYLATWGNKWYCLHTRKQTHHTYTHHTIHTHHIHTHTHT